MNLKPDSAELLIKITIIEIDELLNGVRK